jgi:oxygen-independent coproporphyrinogen III oxidase
MSGVYIHIPYCHSKCDYCNFFSMASQRGRNEIAKAICAEAELRRDYLTEKNISTIYFGGGTPSLLLLRDIELILDCLQQIFRVEPTAEITLEANPDDLSHEKFSALRQAGINRLSIGIQSFFSDGLTWLNRRHDAAQARKSIEHAITAGFTNISIDLIFGIPTQNTKQLEENLVIFGSYKLPHLSAYALTVEPDTALAWKIKKNKVAAVDEEEQSRQFLFLMDWMESRGFDQYEISNYCLPGYESKHNAAYWNGDAYLGLGPSAHSFNGNSRQWNINHVSRYIEAARTGRFEFEKEVLTAVQHHNECIMTAIRTSTGIELDEYKNRYGKERLILLRKACADFTRKGWLHQTTTHLKLTRQGKLFADHIAAELFEVA